MVAFHPLLLGSDVRIGCGMHYVRFQAAISGAFSRTLSFREIQFGTSYVLAYPFYDIQGQFAGCDNLSLNLYERGAFVALRIEGTQRVRDSFLDSLDEAYHSCKNPGLSLLDSILSEE